MMLSLTFVTPLLLAGLVAAAIPVALHLLSRVPAQAVTFPTLRFLRESTFKTARRRKLRDFVLLATRVMLLATFAIAASEPITRRSTSWLGGEQDAAVIVLDNSLSMACKKGKTSRFSAAKTQAMELLTGPDRPELAALVTTCRCRADEGLTAGLGSVRAEMRKASIAYGKTQLLQKVIAASRMLAGQSLPRQSIYIFSDLQHSSFQKLIDGLKSDGLEDIRLLLVNVAAGEEIEDVSVRHISLSTPPIVGRPVTISATLFNSSPVPRVVGAALLLDGQAVGRHIRTTLASAGKPGSSTEVSFHHCFNRPGYVKGQVVIEGHDDLAENNTRRFALQVGPKILAVVVSGQPRAKYPTGTGPGEMLQLALAPYEAGEVDWPVSLVSVESGQLSATSLRSANIAFFCEVKSFTSQQAAAIAEFVSQGGSAVFFLGKGADIAAYNQLLGGSLEAGGCLLDLKLTGPVGQVGPTAAATTLGSVDLDHGYFSGLYDNMEDYLSVRVQRYFHMSAPSEPVRTLMTLANGAPLLVEGPFRQGRTALFATGSSPQWSNLPASSLFLPLVVRMSLASRKANHWNQTYTAGSTATLPLVGDSFAQTGASGVIVTPPSVSGKDRAVLEVPARRSPKGYEAEFGKTDRPGFYTWHLADMPDERAGVFAVNACGDEYELATMSSQEFRDKLAAKGIENVFVGGTLAKAIAQASDAAKGHNWWDVLVAAAICLLVLEMILAGRRQGRTPVSLTTASTR